MKRNWKNLALDLSIVSIIPVILFAMFSLPTNMREMLIFHRDYLNGYEIFTSHFIHEEFDHLVYNIALFLPVTIFLYCLLSMIMNERKLYYKLLAFSLLLAPILISLIYIPINRYIWPVPRSLGFSGIDAYLVGTLSYGITLLLHERLKINLSYAYYSYIFFIASLFVFTYQNSMKLLIIGILLLTVSICSGFLMTKSIDEKAKKKFKFASSFSLLPYVLLFASSWALFPTQFVQGSAAINFDIHYIGFVLGIIVSNFVSNKNN